MQLQLNVLPGPEVPQRLGTSGWQQGLETGRAADSPQWGQPAGGALAREKEPHGNGRIAAKIKPQVSKRQAAALFMYTFCLSNNRKSRK
jgi:hypothetical protein